MLANKQETLAQIKKINLKKTLDAIFNKKIFLKIRKLFSNPDSFSRINQNLVKKFSYK